jgi:hypothetical protein
LLKLGFDVSERTVSRYLTRRAPRSDDARQKWLAFLSNHREAIAAMDSLTVPTVTFRLLYCFFLIDHGRRSILNFKRHCPPDCRVGLPAVARGLSGCWLVQVRPLRSRYQIQP